MAASKPSAIDTLLLEERRYPPDEDFASQANATAEIYERDWREFWEEEGRARVTWFEPFDRLCDWELPYAKWYLGGKLNVCFNCVDRHVDAGNGEKIAFHWEGEPEGELRDISFADLQRDVVRFANGLKKLGVKKGTPVAIYMGMVPELPAALLACARLGAPHSVVFGGFSSEALKSRIQDAECKALITCDGSWRNGAAFPLKEYADAAVADCPSIETVVVLHRTGQDVAMVEGRDVWWHDAVAGQPATRDAT